MKANHITVKLIAPVQYFDEVFIDTVELVDIVNIKNNMVYGLLSSDYEIAIPIDNISVITGVDFINNY